MLTRILEWSLRHRLIVVLLWAGLVLGGAISLSRLPVDAFPDTDMIYQRNIATLEHLGLAGWNKLWETQ